MQQHISVNYINTRTGGIMKLSGLSYKRSRFYGKTQSIMLSILIRDRRRQQSFACRLKVNLWMGSNCQLTREKIDRSIYQFLYGRSQNPVGS